MDAPTQFREAISRAGLTPPDDIQADGDLHRFPSNGKRSDSAGWYVLYVDGIPSGAFGCWRAGLTQSWRADVGRELSRTEREQQRQRTEEAKRKREQTEREEYAAAAIRAAIEWETAKPATADHPYLKRKGVNPHSLRVDSSGRLLVPVRDSAGELQSLQVIDGDGTKLFLSGGRVGGHYYVVGEPGDSICIAEGFATAASIHEATGFAVAVAFNAGNLEDVARTLRGKYPDSRIVVCADDDYRTNGNPGKTKARRVAKAVGGTVAIPDFGADRPDGATDFNDMARHRGLPAVAESIASAMPNAVASAEAGPAEWPVPQSLTASFEPEPYPLDALPLVIREAVEEVQGFVKAPIPLVASSALAAVSIAVQAHADVQRAVGLSGPSSLFLLSIADSGERKSTCDNFFTASIREYEAEQAELAKPDIASYHAEKNAWDAECSGVDAAIKQAAQKGVSTTELRSRRKDLEEQKPKAPRVPRLLYGDATPEAQAWNLANTWPSGGVLSSEAGAILGSHAMSAESQMRNLAILNVLWDGNPQSFDRRKEGGSFKAKGARFTVALQVQEPTLRAFFEKSKELARGTGFLARFLVAWPESTQGSRLFSEPPKDWPALSVFRSRIAHILARPAPVKDGAGLSPTLLTMTPEAKAAWVEYHNAIEAELRVCGDLFDVRDVASKSADNAARLAALFAVFNNGTSEPIDAGELEGASRIAAWHLMESRRFFGELALPPDLANASRLDGWLVAHCRRNGVDRIARRELQRHVTPARLRERDALARALGELVEAGRVRQVSEGKRKDILVNPALILREAS